MKHVSEFTKNTNKYTLMVDNPQAMLWEGKTPVGARFWEVWKKRLITKAGYGKEVGDIKAPRDEDFGNYAWNFYSKDRAVVKYLEITEPSRANLNDLPLTGTLTSQEEKSR